MSSQQVLNEIRDLNLSFLLFAQSQIRSDKVQALYRLGMDEHVAGLVAQMSPQQLVRIASRPMLLCAMRFDDELIWSLLSDSHAPSSAGAATGGSADYLHASVLMAGRRASAAAA
ncbi:flagellar transcriptional regulator FlhD [Ramlibacter sp.]|uniref:flagellar transcriptional regulator FlhD n=1 Tax=Ramlibacter sp. TaxID=1917967 RepID=UPI003D0A8565